MQISKVESRKFSAYDTLDRIIDGNFNCGKIKEETQNNIALHLQNLEKNIDIS